MRTVLPPQLIKGRLREGHYASDDSDGFNGAFQVREPLSGTYLSIIASDGIDPVCEDWEHVSVSAPRRTPSWSEMAFVKRLFWDDEECVVQFHPPKSKYVNIHPNVLHLWRKRGQEFALPPKVLL